MIFYRSLALIIRLIQIVAFIGLAFAFLTAWGEAAGGTVLLTILAIAFVVINLLQWIIIRLRRSS